MRRRTIVRRTGLAALILLAVTLACASPGSTATVSSDASRLIAFAAYSGKNIDAYRSRTDGTSRVALMHYLGLAAAPPNKATLVVSVLGGGKIVSAPLAITCPATCRHTFFWGALVRLTARPFKGWKFARWTGACRGSRGCLLRLRKRATAAGAVFTALLPPPPPAPVQISNFSVCPDTDAHTTGIVGANGQPVPACNRDWSAAPFAPVHQIYCTGAVESGAGKQIELTLIHNGIALLATAPTRVDQFNWYFYLRYLIDPLIPSGNYVCQVKLDSEVVAARPFTVTQ